MTFIYLLNFIVPLLCWSYPGFVTYIMAITYVDHFEYRYKVFKRTEEQERRYQRNTYIWNAVFTILCGPLAWTYLLIDFVAPFFKELYGVVRERFWPKPTPPSVPTQPTT